MPVARINAGISPRLGIPFSYACPPPGVGGKKLSSAGGGEIKTDRNEGGKRKITPVRSTPESYEERPRSQYRRSSHVVARAAWLFRFDSIRTCTRLLACRVCMLWSLSALSLDSSLTFDRDMACPGFTSCYLAGWVWLLAWLGIPGPQSRTE